jgi:hypothetical protein
MLESVSIGKSLSSSERVAISCAVSSRNLSGQRAIAWRRQMLQRTIHSSGFPSAQVHLFRCVKKLIINEREIQS